MKRAPVILVALAALAAAAHAQNYTFLTPPTLAVVDFEVSMSAAEKEASKGYWGQLISQALLTVLVQQNASDVVSTPREVEKAPGLMVYSPAEEARARPGFSLFGPSAEQIAAEQARTQDTRYYFPPIFKIYDKKYVELALQGSAFTTKDLYAKAAGAFSFTDLDFLVLGNVYETAAAGRAAIGFNVRVLNTKRAEELYSYSAVVDRDLHDLPVACALIGQRIMRDILNSHCAQFVITRGTGVKGVNTPFANVPSGNSQGDSPNYRLFWQSRQVEQDDNTVADSGDAAKREVREELFYWTLPGQYVVTVYNIDTQQVRTIPFTVAAGDIKHVGIERAHLEAERGSITIGGVFPTDSYKFIVAEQKRTEQYWWEIGQRPRGGKPITVKFENGEKPEVSVGEEKRAATAAAATEPADPFSPAADYRAATNEIVIRNVMLSAYTITANSQPPAGASDVTGSWRVSTRLAVQSGPLAVDLRSQKDARLMIADFGLQEKKTLEAARKTKVTFYFNPGFGFWNYLKVDDQANVDWLWWRDKAKVTIESEYSPADWDALPDVTYTFEPWATFDGVDLTLPLTFQKSDLEPSRDTVVIVDWFSEAQKARARQAPAQPAAQAAAAAAQPVSQAVPASSTQPLGQAVTKVGPAPSPKGLAGTLLEAGAGTGYGSLTYNTSATVTKTSSGPDLNLAVAVMFHVVPMFAIGVGALLDSELGGQPMVGGAGTVNGVVGNLATGGMAFIFDIGYGTGFTAGIGAAFANKPRTGAYSVRVSYINQSASMWDYYSTTTFRTYPAREWGVFLTVGYLFGI